MTRLPFWAALVALAGCSDAVAPDTNWTEFEPPAAYRGWHREIEVCTGSVRPFDDIRWRAVHAERFTCAGEDNSIGCYETPRTIYLVESRIN